MASGEVALNIALIGQDQFSGMVQKATEGVEALGERAAHAAKMAAQETTKWQDTLTAVSSGFLAAKEGVEVLLAAGAKVGEMALQGEKIHNVRAAFENLNADADHYLGTLKRAGEFQFSDAALRELANQYQQAGFSADQTRRTVALLGQTAATGLADAEQAADAFFEVLAGAGSEALQNFGIMADVAGAVDAYAAANKKAATELTQREQVEARLIAVEREMATVVGSIPIAELSVAVQQGRAAWVNLGDAVSEGFFNATALAVQGMQAYGDEMGRIEKRAGSTAAFIAGVTGVAVVGIGNDAVKTSAVFTAVADAQQKAINQQAEWAKQALESGQSMEVVARHLEGQAKAFPEQEAGWLAMAAGVRQYESVILPATRGLKSFVAAAAEADFSTFIGQVDEIGTSLRRAFFDSDATGGLPDTARMIGGAFAEAFLLDVDEHPDSGLLRTQIAVANE